MMRWVAILAAMMLPSAVAAQERQQFNLICKGKEQASAVARKKDVTRTYRIDLARGVWCIEECSVVLPIVEVNEARLILQIIPRHGLTVRHWIDRATGEVSDVYFEGQCEPATFSQMPTRRF